MFLKSFYNKSDYLQANDAETFIIHAEKEY